MRYYLASNETAHRLVEARETEEHGLIKKILALNERWGPDGDYFNLEINNWRIQLAALTWKTEPPSDLWSETLIVSADDNELDLDQRFFRPASSAEPRTHRLRQEFYDCVSDWPLQLFDAVGLACLRDNREFNPEVPTTYGVSRLKFSHAFVAMEVEDYQPRRPLGFHSIRSSTFHTIPDTPLHSPLYRPPTEDKTND